MINEINLHDYEVSYDLKEELHSVTCAASCDYEKHEKHGFCLSSFTHFNSNNVFSQINDSVKNYINNLSVIF